MDSKSAHATKMRLYSPEAERLYLNAAEHARFCAEAMRAPADIRRLALILAYTGMRLSEARTLRLQAIQLDARIISVRSLKKREQAVIREIPMPHPLVSALTNLRGDPDAFLFGDHGHALPRPTAYRWIKRLMRAAEIDGPRACPRGLRHAYGTRAVLSGVPLHLLQRWMGHASMETTAIYATVLGADQLAVADRMWPHP